MSDPISQPHSLMHGLEIAHGHAICYSGYRDGQSPRTETYPSYEEIREDLMLLSENWCYLRLYDCSLHAERVLQVIDQEGLDLKVMLGIEMRAELRNPNCPWGAEFSSETLLANQDLNDAEVEKSSALAQRYPESVFSVSVGNEACVDWTDHLVSVERLITQVRQLKQSIKQPITFCDNYVPWTNKLAPLAAELDFISIHTYPVWEYKSIDEALAYTQQNYRSVADLYPDKPVVITEAGWATAANGGGIETWNASEELQSRYCRELLEWTHRERILTFVFEAFDEEWKGSADQQEPEKHWGLFNRDRTPKLFMQEL